MSQIDHPRGAPESQQLAARDVVAAVREVAPDMMLLDASRWAAS